MKGKKQDGRKNNGGARAGAGRKPTRKYDYFSPDYMFGAETLSEKVVVVEKEPGSQARRIKKTRFEVIVDAYARAGLPWKKGFKRDFAAFVKVALDTSFDEEEYAYRQSYLEERLQQESYRRGLWGKPQEKKLEPWEKEEEEQRKIREEIQNKVREQNRKSAKAIEQRLKWREQNRDRHYPPNI